MAYEAAIVGNLALAEQWPRLSDTESKPAPNIRCATVCSTAAAGGPSLFARGSSTKAELYVRAQLENSQLDFFVKGDVQTATLVIGETVPVLRKAGQWHSNLQTAEFISAVRSDQGNQQTVVTYLSANPLGWDFTRFYHGAALDLWEKAPVTKFGSLCLSDLSKTWKPGEKLETLRIQVRELYDDFLNWPGSYNQLLLSGSLDYCRSAINKLRNSHVEVQDRVMSQIRSYYSQCYGISQQYQEAKSTVRRLNLQSLQDKFELLQETCAMQGVYPRLEEMEIADIPRD